jgi:hypothetical protein
MGWNSSSSEFRKQTSPLKAGIITSTPYERIRPFAPGQGVVFRAAFERHPMRQIIEVSIPPTRLPRGNPYAP